MFSLLLAELGVGAVSVEQAVRLVANKTAIIVEKKNFDFIIITPYIFQVFTLYFYYIITLAICAISNIYKFL